MAFTPQSYCYAAIIPKDGFIDLNRARDVQKICYFKFDDCTSPDTSLLSLSSQNPCILVLPRNVTGQDQFSSGNKSNFSVGQWLTKVIFADRGFEATPAMGGGLTTTTSWYKIYLEPGQIDAIRFFLNAWPSRQWKLGTETGRRQLYNHLVNDIFGDDSRGPWNAGRGGYNSVEDDKRRDSAQE